MGLFETKSERSTRAGRNRDLAMRTTRASGSLVAAIVVLSLLPSLRQAAAGQKKRKLAFLGLRKHNQLRSLHDSPRLVWSQDLAGDAKVWADRLAGLGCRLQHDTSSGQGENLAVGHASIADAVQDWYDEIRLYDHAAGVYSPDVGHYTQVVWRSTRRLGCAFSVCRGGNQWAGQRVFVCRYDPAGNYETQFLDNVLPPSSGKFPKEGTRLPKEEEEEATGISGVSDFFGNIGNVFGNIGNAFGGRGP